MLRAGLGPGRGAAAGPLRARSWATSPPAPVCSRPSTSRRRSPSPRTSPATGQLFMLRVRGESMIDAGILDGDYVVVRQQPDAEPGDTVVAGHPRRGGHGQDATSPARQGRAAAREPDDGRDGLRPRRRRDLRQGRLAAAPSPDGSASAATPWSRRMSLSFDFSWRSPSVRCLITSTQGRPNSPPGNVRGRVACTATHQAGTTPRLSSSPVSASITGIAGVRMHALAEHRAVSDPCALGDHAAGADQCSRRRRSPARPAAARAPRRCRRRRRGAPARRSARTSRPSPTCRPWCRSRRGRRCSRSSA